MVLHKCDRSRLPPSAYSCLRRRFASPFASWGAAMGEHRAETLGERLDRLQAID